MERKGQETRRSLLRAQHQGTMPLILRVAVAVTLAATLCFIAYAGASKFAGGNGTGDVETAGSQGIPLQINHQGLVTVKGKRFKGTGDFRFALVDPDGNANRWTNDGTNIGTSDMPTAAVSLDVDNGIYSVRLGNTDLANMTEIPASVFDDDNIVLRIWFDDKKGNGVQRLEPDHVLTSAPYAYTADKAAEADYAALADHANTADKAAEADYAALADHANTADSLTKPELPTGVIVMWSGTVAGIPKGWALCDGNNGTPDLTSKFIRSIPNASTDPGSTGGSSAHTHTVGTYTASSHTHSYSGTTGSANVIEWCESGSKQVAARINHTHSYSGTTSAAGAGTIAGTSGEASSLPPYYELAFIMKL